MTLPIEKSQKTFFLFLLKCINFTLFEPDTGKDTLKLKQLLCSKDHLRATERLYKGLSHELTAQTT